jgi:hypothetical protein
MFSPSLFQCVDVRPSVRLTDAVRVRRLRKPPRATQRHALRDAGKPLPAAAGRAARDAARARPFDRALSLLNSLLTATAVVTAIATLVYKVPTGRWMYLFQPCHLQNFLLLVLAASRGPTASRLFNL